MSDYYTYQRQGGRGVLAGTRAQIDELIVKPIVTAPAHERKGYAAVLAIVALAFATPAVLGWMRMRGWL